MRKVMIEWGYRGQRAAYRLYQGIPGLHTDKQRPPVTTNKPTIKKQVTHFVNRPLPKTLPRKPMRSLLQLGNHETIPILRDPVRVTEDSEAVFYFPGCGSERLFSQIGLATLAMLYEAGVQTVLPPGYLCCGYPQTSSGDTIKGSQVTTENRVLFHRLANTLNYLDIKTVIVSCGTCMDQLLAYEFEKIFSGCRLLDIHEYLMEMGYSLEGVSDVQYMYHDPCHSPMKSHDPLGVVSKLIGQPVLLSDRCCGEAGTFAVARPDIATQVRFRKQEELVKGINRLIGKRRSQSDVVKLLTSCPACQQGLARYADDTGLETDYIVVEMIKRLMGDDWLDNFVSKANSGGIERILV